jgi:hypothetical protein
MMLFSLLLLLFTSLIRRIGRWRMTCSRGRPGRRPCLSRAASSVCSTRPDRGEAHDATPQQGCKAGNKNCYVTISFS